jgi:hypothetical protein
MVSEDSFSAAAPPDVRKGCAFPASLVVESLLWIRGAASNPQQYEKRK